MTDSVKSLLVNALLEAEGAELENTECTSLPSNAFSQRMRRIAEHPEKNTKKHRDKRIVIILIAAAIILTGCAAIKPVRTAIAGFIITLFENGSFVDKSADKNGKERITEFYSPSFIPDGYEFAGEDINKHNENFIVSRELEYENDFNKLVFCQLTTKTSVTLDTENAEIKTFKVNDVECISFKNEKCRFAVWEQNGYRFMITAPEDITEETMIKMIESVEKEEFTNN